MKVRAAAPVAKAHRVKSVVPAATVDVPTDPALQALIAEQVLTPLSQNEFDALVSFAFNIGAEAFAASEVVSAQRWTSSKFSKSRSS